MPHHNFFTSTSKGREKIKLSFRGRFSTFLWKKKKLNLKLPLEEDDVTHVFGNGYQDEFHFHTLG
jgi:hypothetical protein